MTATFHVGDAIDREALAAALATWDRWGPMCWKWDTAPLAEVARAYLAQLEREEPE